MDEFCVPTEGPHGERGLQKPNRQGTFQTKHLQWNADPGELCQSSWTHSSVVPMTASSQPDSPPLKQLLLSSAFFLEDCWYKIPEGRDHVGCVSFSAYLSPGRKPNARVCAVGTQADSELRPHWDECIGWSTNTEPHDDEAKLWRGRGWWRIGNKISQRGEKHGLGRSLKAPSLLHNFFEDWPLPQSRYRIHSLSPLSSLLLGPYRKNINCGRSLTLSVNSL